MKGLLALLVPITEDPTQILRENQLFFIVKSGPKDLSMLRIYNITHQAAESEITKKAMR